MGTIILVLEETVVIILLLLLYRVAPVLYPVLVMEYVQDLQLLYVNVQKNGQELIARNGTIQS
jgi:hypothetical protein